MKSIVLILFIIASVSDCSKNDDPKITAELLGKWNWIESSGGFAGKTETPATTGNSITIEFTREKYIKYVNGLAEQEMTYQIEKGKSIRKTEDSFLILYENGRKQSIEIIDNKLILFDECHDCYQNEYVKE